MLLRTQIAQLNNSHCSLFLNNLERWTNALHFFFQWQISMSTDGWQCSLTSSVFNWKYKHCGSSTGIFCPPPPIWQNSTGWKKNCTQGTLNPENPPNSRYCNKEQVSKPRYKWSTLVWQEEFKFSHLWNENYFPSCGMGMLLTLLLNRQCDLRFLVFSVFQFPHL